MNLPWVQQKSAVLPWRRTALFCGLTAWNTGWMSAPIVTVAWDLLQVSMLLQIRQSPFDRGCLLYTSDAADD